MPKELVRPFRDWTEERNERLKDLSSRKKIFGYFCTYTPIELIHAAGFLPMRIFGGSTLRVESADSLTPNFICPYMRVAIERAMRGEYDYLSGVVQGYTCDVACGMVNIWEENIGGELYHTIPLPYNDNDDAKKFYRAVISELSEKFEKVGGKITDESLDASLRLYSEIRSLILNLYDLRYDNKLPISASDFLSVIQAGFLMPPEDYLEMLKVFCEDLEKSETTSSDGIRILVSGSLIEEPRIFEILEESGGIVAADDLCSGLRFFSPPEGSGNNPTDRLIDRYINRFPCPSRTRAKDRAPLFMELLGRSGAKGVIFLLQKFCTPHLADYPILTEELKKNDIPNILIEMEETGIPEGQLRTRLEGFIEMLRD
jgi:bcr-type benzoyl-CoA reductase subunit C